MPKVLSSAAIGVMIVGSWTSAAIQTPPQTKNPMMRPVPTDMQKDLENFENLATKVKADADAAGAAQGRGALGPLIGSVAELQQGLTAILKKGLSTANGDTKKKIDAMAKQAEGLQKEKESLMKLSQEKSDNARARATAAQRVKNLIGELQGSAHSLRSAR